MMRWLRVIIVGHKRKTEHQPTDVELAEKSEEAATKSEKVLKDNSTTLSVLRQFHEIEQIVRQRK